MGDSNGGNGKRNPKAIAPLPTRDYVPVVVPPGEDPDTYVPQEHVGNPIAPNHFCRGWNGKRSKYCAMRAGARTEHPGEGRCAWHGGRSGSQHGLYSTTKHARLGELYEEFRLAPDPLDLEEEVAMCRSLFVDFIERYGVMSEALLAWHDSWEAEQLDLPEERIQQFEYVVNEFEIAVKEGALEPTDKQKAEIAGARAFLDILRKRVGAGGGKPRKILDIADAHRILETTSKIIERIEKIRAENAISRADFIRLTSQMGNTVKKHVSDEAVLKRISDDWLSMVP